MGYCQLARAFHVGPLEVLGYPDVLVASMVEVLQEEERAANRARNRRRVS